jgi:hypothetical protein
LGDTCAGSRNRGDVGSRARRHAFAALTIVPMGMATIHVLTGHSSIAINLRAGLIFAGICGAAGAALAAISLRAARGPVDASAPDRVSVI